MATVTDTSSFSIARPYALATFEYAHEHQDLESWKVFLGSAATVAKDPLIANLLENPEVSDEKVYKLFHEVLSSVLSTDKENFLRLLVDNKRLALLPAIAELFSQYAAALEKISKVRVVTAVPADASFKEKLDAALTKRMKHAVSLEYAIDPAIIGGAVIHIGDRVIDGSIRGKLARLLEFSLR